jgi:hypothetical protein
MLRAHVGHDAGVQMQIAENSTCQRLIEPVENARKLLFSAENPVIYGALIHATLGQVEK